MKNQVGFVLGTLVLLGAASAASAAGSVATPRAGVETVEVVVVKAKRVRPERIDVVVFAAKPPTVPVEARIPPAMPIEMPHLEFAVAATPAVRL
ncbi:MAG TPA: hypothetical protein VFL84_04950 [Gammaproteobacteria bacterium]|nr:hypothetical protein [Gammaproteobacteria bacterium]